MIDLSRQQRWVIIAVVCAFVVGAAVLTARSGLGRQAEVYSLEEPAEQVGGTSPGGTGNHYLHGG